MYDIHQDLHGGNNDTTRTTIKLDYARSVVQISVCSAVLSNPDDVDPDWERERRAQCLVNIAVRVSAGDKCVDWSFNTRVPQLYDEVCLPPDAVEGAIKAYEMC